MKTSRFLQGYSTIPPWYLQGSLICSRVFVRMFPTLPLWYPMVLVRILEDFTIIWKRLQGYATTFQWDRQVFVRILLRFPYEILWFWSGYSTIPLWYPMVLVRILYDTPNDIFKGLCKDTLTIPLWSLMVCVRILYDSLMISHGFCSKAVLM